MNEKHKTWGVDSGPIFNVIKSDECKRIGLDGMTDRAYVSDDMWYCPYCREPIDEHLFRIRKDDDTEHDSLTLAN